MNVSAPFIRRPVATTLLMLAVVIAGTIAYDRLPVSDLPAVDFPTLLVTASLPGANPDTMASAVATPLERQFSTIAGVEQITSASSLGTTQITLQFALSRSIDAAAQDVSTAITAAGRTLPPELPTPPTFQRVNPADQPILYIALTSPTLPLPELDEYGETMLAQRISMVSGVAQVQVFGAQKFAVRVQVSPEALATRNLGFDDVAAAIGGANVNLPTGILDGKHRAYTVLANGQLMRAADYLPVIIAWRNGGPVRLRDIGRAIDDVENNKTAAWFRDQRSVVLAVQRQPGQNTVEVAARIRQLLPSFSAELPASVSLHVVYDRSESIEASVRDVKGTLLLTLALVILVIFLFLRSGRATLIPALALPMSLIGTFAVMGLWGYTLDNLSLMALTLSVGFVVDDAIVVLENIVRHIEAGEEPLPAAFRGSEEIGFTIVSMTLSLSAVFIPVLFLGGILGRLFREFAVTIAVAILLSGAVSLTLSPLLSSRWLRRERPPSERGRLYRHSERAFDWLLAQYDRSLRAALRRRRLVLFGSALVLGVTVWLFDVIPKGFLPSEDTGQLFAVTEAIQGISFSSMMRHQQEAAAILAADPDIESYVSSVGSRGASGYNNGVLFARLVPRARRRLSADALVEQLRPRLARVPGLRVYVQNPPPIRLTGVLTKSQYQYTLQGPGTAQLYAAAQALEARMRRIPGLSDVATDLQIANPEVHAIIDRDQAASVGVTAARIEEALYDAFASRQVSTIYAPDNTYQVILEVLPEYQSEPNALEAIYVRSTGGPLVPLKSLAHLVERTGPLVINHVGQLPAVTLSFNLAPGASLGAAVQAVQAAAREAVPAGITQRFQGTAQAFQSSLTGLGLLLLLAVVVIYLVLGILYESYIHPITILTALPFAGFGALVTLLLFGEQLSVYAFVGIVMLIGLVKKNGIMMIDFALEAQRRGAAPEEAIVEACRVRFRPITMTTMAALMGTLPIALGAGAGAESRRPLGLAVVGGLLFSQLLTLLVTPVFFVSAGEAQQRWRSWRARAA